MDLSIARREAHRQVGGRLSLFLPNLMRISSDQWILDTVRGYKLDLMATPFQHHKSVTFLDGAKAQAMSQEVETLHRNGAIVPISESQEECISPVCLVPKSDGPWRTVINLKAARKLRELQNVSVRQALGMLVAAHPAILPAPLHHRNLERGKLVALNRKDSSDWRLHPEFFRSLEASLGPLTIDLFASRTNHQLPLYCS